MFRQFGQLDSALVYMDDYVRHYTEAYNAEKSKQISTLEKAYEAEKKDKLLVVKNQQIRSQSFIISAISLLLVVTVVLGFVLYRYYRNKKQSAYNLEKLNREIYEKHEEILAQSEELTQANEEIKRMNESLEAEVTLRSQKIEEQNKKLIDYAYFNAHNVRGPLARILGLTFLMAREEDVNQIKEYNCFLIACAQELDHVVKDINSKLDP
jgi:signal transduction histidine kinase